MAPRLPLRVAAGPVLAATLACDVALTGLRRGARPGPELLLLVAVCAAWAAGRATAAVPALRVGVPAVVAVGSTAAVLLSADGTSGHPLAGPLGYGNADGALCLIAVGAAVLTVAALGRRHSRLGTAAAVPVVLAALTRSVAAAGLSVVVGLGLLLVRRGRNCRGIVVAALLLPVAVLSGTVVLGASYTEGAARTSVTDRLVDGTLTERRVQLWSESLRYAAAQPLTGIGPGRFAEESPVARRHRDSRWSHSLVLQTAAETGLPGALLLCALLAWAGASLLAAAQPDGRSVAGALLLGAVLTQAGIDWIAHVGVLPVLTALLVAPATVRVTQSGPADPAPARVGVLR